LLAELTSRPEPQPQIVRAGDPGRAIDGILRRLVAAQEGERNGMLFWAACRLAEHGMQRREIEALLIPIAISAGLTEIEARRTIGSANGRAAA